MRSKTPSGKHIDLDKKIIVLTGATGGIGRAVARALASQGARLILPGRNMKKLKALENLLPGKHMLVEADLSSGAGCETLIKVCSKLCDGVDMLINNAGVSEFGLLQQRSPEKIQQLFHLNLIAPVILCRGFIPLLKTREQAAIVNIGSTFGSIGYAGFTDYCASKFGLRGFTEALRRELADTSINVYYLAPRATKTAFNTDAVVAMNKKLGNQMDSPQVVAQALLELLARRGSSRYIGWPERLFVYINAMLPALVDRSLKKQLPIIRHFTNS